MARRTTGTAEDEAMENRPKGQGSGMASKGEKEAQAHGTGQAGSAIRRTEHRSLTLASAVQVTAGFVEKSGKLTIEAKWGRKASLTAEDRREIEAVVSDMAATWAELGTRQNAAGDMK